jgi:hypothetical protein
MRKSSTPLRTWLRALVGAGLVLHLAGCGTLLYPDRQGQRGGRVDPAVVLLDGALLFLFIVPGLVAYGIDFYTGAVYLPGSGRRAMVIPAPGGDLSDAAVRRLVAQHTGIALPPGARARALPCPDVETLRAWLASEPQHLGRADILGAPIQGG